jgi:hypothetical protein
MKPAKDQTTVLWRFVVPIKTVSEANSHEHWRKRQTRAKVQRATAQHIAAFELQGTGYTLLDLPLPAVVTMTRISPRFLDSDNLQGSLKHVRDGLADWLRVDDKRADVVAYECEQERGSPPGVRVELRAMTAAECMKAMAKADAMKPKAPSKRKAKAV